MSLFCNKQVRSIIESLGAGLIAAEFSYTGMTAEMFLACLERLERVEKLLLDHPMSEQTATIPPTFTSATMKRLTPQVSGQSVQNDCNSTSRVSSLCPNLKRFKCIMPAYTEFGEDDLLEFIVARRQPEWTKVLRIRSVNLSFMGLRGLIGSRHRIAGWTGLD